MIPRLAAVLACLGIGRAAAQPIDRWDPTLVRGAARSIDFTVTEGFMEAVDLSPDSRWVVFDLLGHVYRVAAAGGEAECLTQASGAALNYHARFSPDGKTIAFVSDRGGQDNLWLMDADGRNPRPVFLDLRSRVRQPAWLSNGDLVAVRVFPSILNWEMHRTTLARFSTRGGPPRELLASDQAQFYWPAPSPDGRYLYFYRSSLIRDLDGVTQNQRLGRLELASGRVDDLSAPSSTVLYRADPIVEFAPEISPDGRTLAFGRRIPGGEMVIRGHRYAVRTALWLRDLASGAERVLVDPIEPDATQGNAVRHMKVVPGYRWAADGRSLVVPEGGQIRRVWVESGKIETIPFSARVRRQISETARSAVRLTGDTVRSRFLRWPAAAPNGTVVAIEAFGRLWLGDRATGTTRPLTSTAAGFAVTPSWSPDGRLIAYATWDDVTGGRVWTIPADGGEPNAVMSTPGQYLHPLWSSDDRAIIVLHGGFGGTRTDHTWWDVLRITLATRSIDTIGQVPEPVRVSLLVNGAVVAPVRQPQGDLYAPSRRGEYAESRWRLTSLRGPPISGVVPGEAAVVSPDGHWVAFVNRLDLYLAPMAVARASRAPSRSDRGIRRITHRGGLYPRWLDNDRLEFQSGDRYYQWHRATGRLDSVRFAASLPRPPVGGSVALTGARVLTPRRRSRPPPPRFASDLAPPRRICPLPRLRGHHRHRSRLGVRPRLPHRRADRGRRDRGAADLSIR